MRCCYCLREIDGNNQDYRFVLRGNKVRCCSESCLERTVSFAASDRKRHICAAAIMASLVIVLLIAAIFNKPIFALSGVAAGGLLLSLCPYCANHTLFFRGIRNSLILGRLTGLVIMGISLGLLLYKL